MELSSFLINHVLFFFLGVMFVGAIQAIDVWRKDKTQFAPMVQRAGPLIMALLFVLALYVVLGPDGWVYTSFKHYQKQVVCFPTSWDANLYPIPNDLSVMFRYRDGNSTYFGKANSTTLNWSNFLLNQTVPTLPTTQ